MTKELSEIPAIRSISQRVGRAESADDTWGPNYSEIEVDLRSGLSGRELSEADADIRKALLGFPGLNFSLKPFLTERVEETLSGNTAAVAANIYGNDLAELDDVAEKVAATMASVRGARDVHLRTPVATPQLTIRLREDDLVRWGLDAVDVLDIVRTAYQGDIVGQAYDGHRAFNIIALLDAESRNSVAKIAELPLRTPRGAYVLLRQVADVAQTTGRYQVDHFGAHRCRP